MAVSMFAKLGYQVVASTGKEHEHNYLRSIGANRIISREEVGQSKKALGKQLWAGAVDPVGGETLAIILSHLKYGGSVAVSGFLGGRSIPASVFPFILRGANILGIDSVYCPMEIRQPLWERMANDLKPKTLLTDIGNVVSLKELPEILDQILKGEVRGRTIVKF